MKTLIALSLFFLFFLNQAFSQCTPAIPSTAIVTNGNAMNNGGFDTYWVCSGDTFRSNGGIRDVFLEPGAVMYTGGGIDNIYVKAGAKFFMTGGIHDVYYDNFSDLSLGGGISTPISCPGLNFNYSSAPVNGCIPPAPVGGTVTSQMPSCYGKCDGMLTAAGTGGIQPYSYQWIGGPATAVYNNLCAGTYQVIISDANLDSDTVTTILSDLALVANKQTETACGLYVFNGVVLTTSGTYSDTFPTTSGCDSLVELMLTIDTVDISVAKNGTTLTATSASSSYKWLDCQNGMTVIPGLTAQTFVGSPGGSYAVVVTQGSCMDTSACIALNPLGIELADQGTVNIFPNPVQDRLFIEGRHSSVTPFSVYRMDGALVLSGVLKEGENSIKLESLLPGQYVLRLQSEERVHRFVVE